MIDIINANNYAPEFVNLDGDNQVYEEDIVGSLVMIVSALDRDRDIVTYQILDQSLPGAFYINAVTGQCSLYIQALFALIILKISTDGFFM